MLKLLLLFSAVVLGVNYLAYCQRIDWLPVELISIATGVLSFSLGVLIVIPLLLVFERTDPIIHLISSELHELRIEQGVFNLLAALMLFAFTIMVALSVTEYIPIEQAIKNPLLSSFGVTVVSFILPFWSTLHFFIFLRDSAQQQAPNDNNLLDN